MPDKVLIWGKGYISQQFQKRLPVAVTRTDLLDAAAVRKTLEEHRPDVVINCAGRTGRPNIDWCEDHKMETMQANVTGPLNLADACLNKGIFLTHIGSGCVYEGDNDGKGFSEDDPPNFFGSFYSRTKMLSEHALKEFPVLQLRLRMPFAGEPHERNLITKLVKYDKVISVRNSLSILHDFVSASLQLIAKRKTGIFNVTNPGAITHSEILDLYKEIVDPNFKYHSISLEELDKITKARRSNCVLNAGKLAKEGIVLPEIHQAVRQTLMTYRTQSAHNL